MGFFDIFKKKKKEEPKIEEDISFAPPGYEPPKESAPVIPEQLQPEPVHEVPKPVEQPVQMQTVSESEKLVKLIMAEVQARKEGTEIQQKLMQMGYSEEQIKQGVETAIKEMGIEDYIAAA